MALDTVTELVIANRILAHEDVVDAYGHVSVRQGDRFLLSCSRSPSLVEAGDIVEHTLDGQAAKPEKRPLYLERFIHAAIYEARPDVMAVVHAHAEDVLPFTITPTALKPVIHSGAFIGAKVPVWDIADRFGSRTNLLVTDMAQGRDLAKRLAMSHTGTSAPMKAPEWITGRSFGGAMPKGRVSSAWACTTAITSGRAS